MFEQIFLQSHNEKPFILKVRWCGCSSYISLECGTLRGRFKSHSNRVIFFSLFIHLFSWYMFECIGWFFFSSNFIVTRVLICFIIIIFFIPFNFISHYTYLNLYLLVCFRKNRWLLVVLFFIHFGRIRNIFFTYSRGM